MPGSSWKSIRCGPGLGSISPQIRRSFGPSRCPGTGFPSARMVKWCAFLRPPSWYRHRLLPGRDLHCVLALASHRRTENHRPRYHPVAKEPMLAQMRCSSSWPQFSRCRSGFLGFRSRRVRSAVWYPSGHFLLGFPHPWGVSGVFPWPKKRRVAENFLQGVPQSPPHAWGLRAEHQATAFVAQVCSTEPQGDLGVEVREWRLIPGSSQEKIGKRQETRPFLSCGNDRPADFDRFQHPKVCSGRLLSDGTDA